MHPFTSSELEAAYKLLLPPDEAKRLAAPLLAPERSGLSEGVYPCEGESLTEDTLALLSIVSEELSEKVSKFRISRSFGTGAADEQQWLDRCAEVRKAVQVLSRRERGQ
jgi:hypothetical protein